MSPTYQVYIPMPGVYNGLLTDMAQWIKANIKHPYDVISSEDSYSPIRSTHVDGSHFEETKALRSIFCFTDLNEALLFKLTWGGSSA